MDLTARVVSLSVGAGAPAVSGVGRVAVDPERHGDDVGRDPQELEVGGVDAPVVVQIRDHIRRIVWNLTDAVPLHEQVTRICSGLVITVPLFIVKWPCVNTAVHPPDPAFAVDD